MKRVVDKIITYPLSLRVDPGSKFTGISLVNNRDEVVWGMEIQHRWLMLFNSNQIMMTSGFVGVAALAVGNRLYRCCLGMQRIKRECLTRYMAKEPQTGFEISILYSIENLYYN